jgi:predicted nucleotide-binding protein
VAKRPATRTADPDEPVALAVPREEARARLVDRIEIGRELSQVAINSPESFDAAKHDYQKWSAFNTELLKQLFTTDALSKEYAWWGIAVVSMGRESLGQQIAKHQEDLTEKLRRLDSIVERLELYPLSPKLQAVAASQQDRFTPVARSKKVFVVHGRDELSKTNLEVFLHEIGLEPVVLHRQADEGQTIIEKFEKHAEVGYAFILLTPDEVAYLAEDESLPDAERNKERRARPNVIFEFGYFVGRLGRSRVCCVYTGDVALPSDIHGMIYKKFHTSIDEVAYGIIKDLKAAGYGVA